MSNSYKESIKAVNKMDDPKSAELDKKVPKNNNKVSWFMCKAMAYKRKLYFIYIFISCY